MPNNQFPLLSFVSLLMRILGAIVILAGLFYAYKEGIAEPNMPNHRFGAEDAMQIAGGVFTALLGLAAVAFGELVGVLFAIEKNTRQMAEAIERGQAPVRIPG